MRKVVAFVTLKREFSARSGFWSSHIRALGLTAEAYTAEEADAKLLRQFSILINTYRRLGEDKVGRALTRAGIEWAWEDEYEGKRRPVDTGSSKCALHRRASPESTRASTLNALPLAA